MHILINKKFLYFNNYKTKCAIGKRGINYKTKEGDFITPKGNFKIKYILYRKDRIKNFKTKIKSVVIKKNMGWCDDPRSNNYNKIIKLPSVYSYEKLYKKENIYDVILVLNYNMNPTIKNKGSAIFIHVAKKKFNKTEGCVAIKKKDLLNLIKKLKKNSRVKIESQR